MATSFGLSEIQSLVGRYRTLIEGLDAAVSRAQGYPAQVSEAAQKLLVRGAYERLREVPIQVLRERVPRLRVKSLQERGFETLADVYAASVFHLAAVKGISETSAYAMKREAASMAADMRVGAKISLSADDVNPDSTALVVALARYLSSEDAVRAARAADDPNARSLADRAAETLGEYRGLMSRLFAFGEKKRVGEQAYGTLRAMVEGDYGAGLARATSCLLALDAIAPNEAWDEFRANPIRFTNALEALVPDLVGTADTYFGLPEELAREVQEECFFPDGLLCDLRRYQEWGVKYILHQGRVLLGDEMGLGKTVQAIAAMVSLRNTGATHFVVVCPASVLSNWSREIRRHSRLLVTELYGAGRQRAAEAWGRMGGVGVTTYETLSRLSIPEKPIGLLVVDEAHYVKNAEAKRSMAVRELAARCERVLFMTGTPLENNVHEMVSLIDALRPDVAAKLAMMDSLPSAPRFRQAVVPVYYRRKREDVLTELPELVDTREWCKMGCEETRVYEEFALGRNFAAMRRVSWNAESPEASSKAKRLLELVEEAKAGGRKILVFSFFLDTIHAVMETLGTRALPPITGSTPVPKRQELIDEYDKASAGTALVAQIQAGGTGLNIQSASVVVICEPQLKPSIENQAISRAYRMGQSRNVLVYHLLCENSIDERIVDLLDEKQRIFDEFADKSEAAKQSVEIDERGLKDLIEEEIARINGRGGAGGPAGDAGKSGSGGKGGDGGRAGEGRSQMPASSFARSAARPAAREAEVVPVGGLSVTQRIRGVPGIVSPVAQPYGGYIRPRDFDRTELEGMRSLHGMERENVSPGCVGMAVDYLSRFVEGASPEKAFSISLRGARMVGEEDECQGYLRRVRGTDDDSIRAALCAVGYDVAFRAGPGHFKGAEVVPNVQTIENVREMVRRSQDFFAAYGPVVADGMTFTGGYTDTVSAGDGDFMTRDTLWDFKVSKKPPTSQHTLQVLMYWRLGLHSIHPEFKSIEKLGIFNPRLGIVYTLPVSRIPKEVIEEVEKKVIGY